MSERELLREIRRAELVTNGGDLTVETFEVISLENNRCFPIQADIRAETRLGE